MSNGGDGRQTGRFPPLEPTPSMSIANQDCKSGTTSVASDTPRHITDDDPFKSDVPARTYIEFTNTSSFHMEYEVFWNNKPKPKPKLKPTARPDRWGLGGWFARPIPSLGFGRILDKQGDEDFEHSSEFFGILGPDLRGQGNVMLTFVAPEGCKEVFVVARR